jgi:triphosphatase
MELELCLAPSDAPRLPRLTVLAPMRRERLRSRAVQIVWHDSADKALARQGMALAEQRPGWRLERLHPGSETWPPGMPAPVLASGRDPTSLGQAVPDALMPVAAFKGRASSLPLTTERGPVALTLLNGSVHTVAGERAITRLHLDGSAPAVQSVALALAGELPLSVPRASFAAAAIAVATGGSPPPRRLGAPDMPAGLSVGAAFAHVVSHLTDVILHFAPAAAAGNQGTEPVHQMRVAVRRLRSALKVFRPAIRCPDVEAIDVGLKALAARLGPTRDWDVFVTETGASVARTFSTEKRLQRVLAAAERRRRACHEELRAYLATSGFRQLGIELACIAGSQDWHATLGDTEHAELAVPLEAFAAGVLNKRLKKLQQVEGDVTALEPAALHAIRLRAKRLRYAMEIFAPLHPGRSTSRFIRRISKLQDQLGAFNDASVAAGLLDELSGGGGQAFGSGLVQGYVGAHGERTRKRIGRAWHKCQHLTPFWS